VSQAVVVFSSFLTTPDTRLQGTAQEVKIHL
jgi:hypothetical protein